MEPAGGRGILADGRAAAGVFLAAALLRAGTAGRFSQIDLTVVSYNVRAGIGPGVFPSAWWQNVDRGRLRAMAEFIAFAGADFVALQEVALASAEGAVLDQPATFGELTGLDYRYGAVWHYPLVELGGRIVGASLWGNVVLSRHPITSTTTHSLPVAANDDPTDPVDVEPRCALACKIETPTMTLTFMSTHLAYPGARARRLQIDRLAALAAEIDGPLILAGDLNAAIEDPELAPLVGAFTDAFAAVGISPGHERRESCGGDRIDHVLTRGFQAIECRVAREAGEASDHWPVVARLRASDGPGSS